MLTIKPYHETADQICRHLRLDANESVFFQTALEYVKQQTYDVVYIGPSAFRLFPMSTEAGPGANTIVTKAYDGVGNARIIASYADDLPKVGVSATESRTAVRSIGASYGWSLQDVRAAMLGGFPLESRLALQAVRAHNQLMNDIAWAGDASYNLPGLKTQTSGTTTTATTGNWAAATADQIIADVNEPITSIVSASSGAEFPNLVLMPPAQFALISTKSRSTTSDTTVLTFLRAAYPGIRFEQAVECIDWSSTNDALIVMTNDAQHLSMEVPQPYEEMPVERHALRFEVATHTRFGGLLVYYPKSVAIRTGI
jgi:hypothetical protein